MGAVSMGAKFTLDTSPLEIPGDEAAVDVIEVAGSIKWFDVAKGYGFIVPDNGLPDILLHVTCLRRDGYQTASGGGAATGTTAIVKFVDGAKASDIAAELSKRGMAIVDGPKPGGTFVVRLSPEKLSAADKTARANDLRTATGIVGAVLP